MFGASAGTLKNIVLNGNYTLPTASGASSPRKQRAASSMGAAEYEERKLVLEGARGDNHANAEIVALKERYARGELTTSAYVEARNKLLGLG